MSIDWAISQVFPGDCWNRMFVQNDWLNDRCVPAVLSRVLGLGLTVGSAFLFLPQIWKIHRARSAQGISLIAQLLALLAAGSTCSYSYYKQFVISQWGDSLAVFIQLTIIIMQILYFVPETTSYTFAFMAFVWMLSMAVTYSYIPFSVIQSLQAGVIPIIAFSKGIQIVTNFRNKSTGQLSLVSVFLQFSGCLVRIFTSIQETGDSLVIGSFLVAASLNGIIFIQMFLYWKPNGKSKKE